LPSAAGAQTKSSILHTDLTDQNFLFKSKPNKANTYLCVNNTHLKITQNIMLAVDIVLFGYEANSLFVLLIKQRFGPHEGKWVLPGGFVKDGEGLIQAAKRELKEETGVSVSALEQLYTFGDDIKRDDRFRAVSVAYFGTVNPKKMVLKAQTDALDANWFPIKKIRKLPFDHNNIIKKAQERLKSKLSYQPIGFDLLAPKFPFSDLEALYTTILEKDIDRRNFRKKILAIARPYYQELQFWPSIGYC